MVEYTTQMNFNNETLKELMKMGSGWFFALVLIFIGYKILTNHFVHTDMYIQDNTKILIEVSESVRSQSQATDRLSETIQRLNEKL